MEQRQGSGRGRTGIDSDSNCGSDSNRVKWLTSRVEWKGRGDSFGPSHDEWTERNARAVEQDPCSALERSMSVPRFVVGGGSAEKGDFLAGAGFLLLLDGGVKRQGGGDVVLSFPNRKAWAAGR